MKIKGIRLNDMHDGQKLAEVTGTTFHPVYDRCIARVDDEGNLLGGVLYNGWTGRGGSIGMHVAGLNRRWINKVILWMAFDYPFNQLGVRKIFGQVPESKPDVIDFDMGAGFQIEHRITDVYPDGDMILLSMYREQCRYLDDRPTLELEEE